MALSTAVLRRSVDVAVIGAGTAGLAAYRAAAAITPRVVLIESGPLGTMCARAGCMPSKLLVAAACAAHEASDASRFGITGSFHVDGAAVMARLQSERDRFVGFVLAKMARIPAEDQIRGRARFVAPGAIEVDGVAIDARAVVVAAGSTPTIPSLLASLGDRLVVNEDVFAWTTLPESVAVFGAGAIGLELGQALHRLGVRVHVFGRGGTVGPLSDPVVRAAAEAALRAEIALDVDAKVHAVRREGDGVAVEFEDSAGTTRAETFAFALAATGRHPDLAGLGLEEAGLALDSRGVPLFDRTTLRCGASSVFVAGDASGDVPVLHVAGEEGKIAGENAARYPDVRPGARRSRLNVVFCDPQIAVVGATFKELSRAGEFVTGEVSFEDQGRARIMGQNRGRAHLYADPASGRFLGAEMAAPSAEHLAHLLAWAHQQGLTIEQMLAMPIYHPVVEEGLRTAMDDARARLHARRDEPVVPGR